MDKSVAPGIAFRKLHLLACEVGSFDPTAELRFNVSIADFSRAYSADKSQMDVKVTFDLMGGIENPPCKFTCTFLGVYFRPPDAGMSWEDFRDHIALAHMLPFVREFVFNITNRMPLQSLMMPPTNAHRLLDQLKRREVSAPPGDLRTAAQPPG